MTIEVTTATAPSHWASFLVNGDASGMESEDLIACMKWLESMAPWYVVGCEDDEHFSKWHDATCFALAATCCTYIFHKINAT